MFVIDTETGGLDPARCALVELAAVHSNGDEFHAFIRPPAGLVLEDEALAVHGLSKDWLRINGRDEAEVMQEFRVWIAKFRGEDWGGVNPQFDREFVNEAFRRCGMKQRLWHCPICLGSLAWFSDFAGLVKLQRGNAGRTRRSLDAILEALGLSRAEEVHGALEDARLTLQAFEMLIKRLKTGGVKE